MFFKKTLTKKHTQVLLLRFYNCKLTDDFLFKVRGHFNCSYVDTIDKILLSDSVPKKIKITLSCVIFPNIKALSTMKNSVRMIVNVKILHSLEFILKLIQNTFSKQKTTRILRLTSVKEISAYILKDIKSKLREYFKYQNIRLALYPDERILGGVIIRDRTNMLDLSVLLKTKVLYYQINTLILN